MKFLLFLFTATLFFTGCKKESPDPEPEPGITPAEAYYFPPLSGDEWAAKSAVSTGWNENALQAAFDYAGTKQSYGMIILHHGKIVKEQYWNGWNRNTVYYLASAGKSVTALLAGIAQKEGSLNINNKTSQYLGTGWTSAPPAKENLITVKHQLTMTTGLEDNVPDQNCLTPACQVYKADAGTRWAYYNASYHLLHNVIASAAGVTFNQFSKQRLFDKIGMPNSLWFDHVMYCTTREAARFGSLVLQRGTWNAAKILDDEAYFNAMVNTSQNLNLSYGYLWWLNGKSSYMLPQTQFVFSGPMVTFAPNDLIMALGKDDKKIYVVPSLDVVVVRLGDDSGTSTLGPSSFDYEIWNRLKPALGY